MGQVNKKPHPLKKQGWDTNCIPRFHPGCSGKPKPLIGTITGAPGGPFPAGSSEVVSVPGRGTEALQLGGFLSGNLSGRMCLHHCFYDRKIAHFFRKVKAYSAQRIEFGAVQEAVPPRKIKSYPDSKRQWPLWPRHRCPCRRRHRCFPSWSRHLHTFR